MLDDFRRPSVKPFFLFVEILILIADFDPVIAAAGAVAGKGKAALLCVVGGRRGFHQHRVIHKDTAAAVFDGNDGLRAADHIGGQAYAGITVGGQGVQKVLARLSIFPAGLLRFPLEEENIFDDRTNHEKSPFVLSDTCGGDGYSR